MAFINHIEHLTVKRRCTMAMVYHTAMVRTLAMVHGYAIRTS
jgi:hypothetical protein